MDDVIRATGATAEDLARLPRVEPPTEGPGEYGMSRAGDEVQLAFTQHGVKLAFAALHEGSDGIHAELDVTSSVVGWMYWARLNLSSSNARRGLAKNLNACHPAPWPAILDHACRTVALEIRRGAPIEPLVPMRRSSESRYLLHKLLIERETNLLYGDGGVGKSLLALGLAVAVGLGVDLPAGLRSAGRCATLYLDWESTREEHQDRLARLLDGLGVTDRPPIYHREMARGVADDAAFLRAEVARLGVGLVIVDSLAPACGAEPEGADAAIRTFNALRSFTDATRLVVGHVSKVAAEQRSGAVRPYGSVYVLNLARNAWELRRSAEEDEEATLGFYHQKVNSGRKLPPFGLRVEGGDTGPIRFHSADLSEAADLMARASVRYRIEKALTTSARTIAELVEQTSASRPTVARTLRRLKRQGKVIPLDSARWGWRT
jgi:hypothetical protein